MCGGIDPYPPKLALSDGDEVTLDACRRLDVSYYLGAQGGPRLISEMNARCEDPTLCAVEVVATRRGAIALVVGKRPGQGIVRVDYVDPESGKPASQQVRLRFVAPAARAIFDVGRPAPVHRSITIVFERDGVRYSCGYTSNNELRTYGSDVSATSLGSAKSDPTAFYEQEHRELLRCTRERKVADLGMFFCFDPAQSEAPIDPTSIFLCASREEARFGGVIDGVVIQTRVDGRWRPTEVRGKPDGRVCLLP